LKIGAHKNSWKGQYFILKIDLYLSAIKIPFTFLMNLVLLSTPHETKI
jgi:hypothetical protein